MKLSGRVMAIFGWDRWVKGRGRSERAILAALSRSQAVVEFGPDGVARSANERFLGAVGARVEALVGQPHGRFFTDGSDALWADLRQGLYVAGVYRARGPSGRQAWFQASYNPVFDRRGRVVSVLFYGADITAEREAAADIESRLAVLERTQGVVEFSLDGMVLATNDVFLDALGYRREELAGRHHSVFVDEEESRSDAYIGFWRRLRSGLHDAGLYRRLGKDGRVVWIQATYNPIFDANGRPVKIVKYALEMNAETLATQAEAAYADTAAVDALDLMDSAGLRANALSMGAAIDAALAQGRGMPSSPAA